MYRLPWICCVVALSLVSRLNYARGDEGLIVGRYRCLKSDLPDLWKVREMPFLLACDANACLVGWVNSQDRNRESYLLANKGNDLVVSIEVLRQSGANLFVEGDWTVRQFVEQVHMKLDKSFESRYGITGNAEFMNFALPIFLNWSSVGLARDVFLDALNGKSYDANNSLGEIEISGVSGIGFIRSFKDATDLFEPTGKTLTETKFQPFSDGLKSISRRFTFSPERIAGDYKPFTCRGTIDYTTPSGRTYGIEVEVDVTLQGDATEARRYVDRFIGKLPSDKAIVSRSEITTVLDQGKQKVAVDLDVTRGEKARFSNQSNLGYYLVVGIGLLAVSFWAFLRWTK